MERPPGDSAAQTDARASDVLHRKRAVTAIRSLRAHEASASETTTSSSAIPNPSARASPSQPVMISPRMFSSRYETGFAVAAARNQSTSIRFRGRFIDEMNRNTKKTGKRPWTASPEPVRSAAKQPTAPKPSTTSRVNTNRTTIPSGPDLKRTPTASPTAT